MPDAWRIDSRKRAASSFSGYGAALAGGRWNPTGIHVVYASQHLAAASLEKFVHLPKPIPTAMKFVKFELTFHGVAIERAALSDLPADWRSEPVPPSTQQFGAEWFRRGKTAVLAVPSAIIPEEVNYVLNPLHPDFGKIKISAASAFTFDPRLAELLKRG
jgi:RES domain-containing protein